MMNNNRAKIIAALFLLLLVVTIVIGTRQDSTTIDSLPEESTVLNPSKYANIIDSTDSIASSLGGVIQYDQLSEDIYYFGKVTYDDYRKDIKKVVGFKIASKIEKKENTIIFDGRYGSSKNKILIQVDLLPNKRIKTKITDQNLNKILEKELPSGKDFNSYISNLPISGEKFIIEYSTKKDNIVIQLFERDSNLTALAIDSIKEKIKDGSYDSKKITVLFPPNTVGN